MTMVVSGTCESKEQITNTCEDLLASGIPQEQIFVEKSESIIKVMIANSTEPEVETIFKRHEIQEISVTHH